MSVKVMSRVWDYSKQSGGALLVLLALADFADDDGYCFPSVTTIAKKSRLSERQTQRVLSELEALGELQKSICRGAKQSGDGGGFTNRYRVLPGLFETRNAPQKRQIESPEEGCQNVTPQIERGDMGVTPQTPKKPIRGVTFATERGDMGVTQTVSRTVNSCSYNNTPPTPKGEAPVRASENPVSFPPDINPFAPDTDAFAPEDLVSEPLPPALPRTERERRNAHRDEKRVALMAAFRAAKFGKPMTDPIPVPEFNRMRQSADDLIAEGVTPEQIFQATNAALDRWSDSGAVQLKSVAEHLTDLLTAQRVKRKLTANEARIEEGSALIRAKASQLAQAELAAREQQADIPSWEPEEPAPRTISSPRPVSEFRPKAINPLSLLKERK